METPFFSFDNYQIKLVFYMMLILIVFRMTVGKLIGLLPEIKEMRELNQRVAEQRKKEWPDYVEVQRYGLWALPFLLLYIFGVFPFFLTAESQPWWQIPLDAFAVLMVYDLIYYVTHRFVFHGSGPLVWMHAVHHRQKNPCQKDAAYIHPLESIIGLGLLAVSVASVGLVLGDFHITTMLIVMVIFGLINGQNHSLFEVNHFPFKYMHYISKMHHVHHLRFGAGNFATISLLYDWLFGTYDSGDGWGKKRRFPTADTVNRQA